jgi:hypothetical protein
MIGLTPPALRLLIKRHRRMEVPVVRDCHRQPSRTRRLFHQLVQPHCSVQKGKLGVAMQVDE